MNESGKGQSGSPWQSATDIFGSPDITLRISALRDTASKNVALGVQFSIEITCSQSMHVQWGWDFSKSYFCSSASPLLFMF